MAISVAGRTALLRAISRTTTTVTTKIAAASTRSSPSSTGIRSTFAATLAQMPRGPASRCIRRELVSLLPVHSAIASACLVSELPSESSTSEEDTNVLTSHFGCGSASVAVTKLNQLMESAVAPI